MADRPYQFVGPMLAGMHSLRDVLGTDVMLASRETYNLILQLLALHAMTLKIIQDLHPDVVTDAALQDRLNTAVDTGPNGDRSGWPGWILLQVPPEKLAQYGATTDDNAATLHAKVNAFWASQQ